MRKSKFADEITFDQGEPFVYLKKGFRLESSDFSQDGSQCQHCFGERSMKDANWQLKNNVVACNCDVCQGVENEAIA